MTKDLKARLDDLGRDPRPFLEALRERTGRAALPYEDALRDMVLSLPELAKEVGRWTRAPNASPRAGRLGEFALAYLKDPMDLLPEKTLGLFGYLDDAYLLAGAYEKMAADAAPRWRLDLALLAPDWRRIAREMLPLEMGRVDRMMNLVERVSALSLSGRPA